MNIRISIFCLTLCCLFTLAQAQESTPKIKFDKSEHNFGTVDQGDPTEVTFKFTNVSDAPLQLQKVKASCGCTTPNWPREEIAAGETGDIHVRYDSKRIGKFTKSITVTYDWEEKPVVLYIRGDVKPSANGMNLANYKEIRGGLAFEKTRENIGLLESDKNKDLTFKVKNISDKPIQFNEIDKEIMFDVIPKDKRLEPGRETTISVKVKGGAFLKEGNFTKTISLYTDDAKGKAKELIIGGVLKKVLSAEEKANAPHIEFVKTDFKGGTAIEGEKVVYAYKFKNTGGSNLEIANVKASCGCTATAPKDKVVKPGAESEIVATFNSRGRVGMQHKSVTVKTNDPENPTIVLRFQVEVIKDPFHADSLGPTSGQE